MRVELAYPNTFDQEVCIQAAVNLGTNNFRVLGATIAGSVEKPNEDTFAVALDDTTVFGAIFDGTTSLKPIEGLGEESGAHFASHFLKDNLDKLVPTVSPQQAILQLNEKLLDANTNLGGQLADTHSLPASTATIVKFEQGDPLLHFAHVGDSFGIAFYEGGRSFIFTDDKNKRFDAGMFSLIKQVAKARGITPREAREDAQVKTAGINMFIRRNNNPNGDGSGILNGDPHLAKYIQTGRLALNGLSAVLLGSDGLLPPGWSLDQEQTRQNTLAVILDGGFPSFFDLKHDAEDRDPDWNYVRYKHSDDATGLLFQFD